MIKELPYCGPVQLLDGRMPLQVGFHGTRRFMDVQRSHRQRMVSVELPRRQRARLC